MESLKCRKACSVRVSEGYNRVTFLIFKKKVTKWVLAKMGIKGQKRIKKWAENLIL